MNKKIVFSAILAVILLFPTAAFAEQILAENDCNSSVPLYRFWSPKIGDHFYTIDEKEKNRLLTTSKDWQYSFEGIEGYAYPTQKTGTIPLYRFWNSKNSLHFYTTSETEKNKLQTTHKEWNYIYEGIAAYLYQTQQTNTIPLYRFWNTKNNDHFYTTSEAEKNKVLTTKEWGYSFEGITGYNCNSGNLTACSKNSDCGTDGYSGEQSCQSGKIYQDYIAYSCINPGKTTSTCINNTTKKLVETCQFGCNGNICALDPSKALAINFETIPQTTKTNMKYFPVTGGLVYGEITTINGKKPDQNSYDGYFSIIELQPGNNTIKLEKIKGSQKTIITKNVIYDPNYSTAKNELIYTTTLNYTDAANEKNFLAVLDYTNNTYLGVMKDVKAYGISPDGKTVIAGTNGKIIAINTANNVSTEISLGGLQINGYNGAIKYSRDGTKIYAGKAIFDAKTFKKIGTINAPNDIEKNTFVSWDDSKIFYRENQNYLGYYSLAEAKYYSKYSQFSYFTDTGFGVTKDNKYLISTGCSWQIGYIDVFDISTGNSIKTINNLANCSAGIVFSDDGKTAYLSFSGSTLFLDTKTFSVIKVTGISGISDNIELTKNGTLIISGYIPGYNHEGVTEFKINSNNLQAIKAFYSFTDDWVDNFYYKKAS